MFEYMNYNILVLFGVVGVVIFFLMIDSKDKLQYLIPMIMLLIITALVFYDGYSQFSTAKKNIIEFRSGITLKCYSGGGLYSSANTYRVSKEDGWSMERDYFINKNLMIRANKCDEF